MDCLIIITTWRLTTAWCKPKRAQYGTHSSFYGLGLGNHTQLFWGGKKVGFFPPSIRVDLTRGGMDTRRQRSLGVFLGVVVALITLNMLSLLPQLLAHPSF